MTRLLGLLTCLALLSGACTTSAPGPNRNAGASSAPSGATPTGAESPPHHTTVDETKDVSFVSPSHGWALLWRTDPGQSFSRLRGVYETRDGGTTWRLVGRPTSAPVVTRLRFGNAEDGFAFGPDLFATNDGGARWPRVAVNGSVLDLETQGVSVWMLVGQCSYAGSGRCRHVRLERSTDAGRTWTSTLLPRPVRGDSEDLTGNLYGPQLSLVRAGSQTGWVVSASGGNPSLRSVLLGTTDGSSTWTRLPNPCQQRVRSAGSSTVPLTFEEHLSAVNIHRLWMVCTDEPAMSQADRVLYRSADGGHHWRRATVACCFGNGLQVAAISWRRGWETDNTAAYALGSIVVGRERGKVVAENRGLWVSLSFLNGRFGWAATSTNLLYRTTEGGRNWAVRSIGPGK